MARTRKLARALEACALRQDWKNHALLTATALLKPEELDDQVARVIRQQDIYSGRRNLDFNDMCVLIVDDEKDVCEILREVCEELTENIITCENGWEAARELGNNEKIDLIITDLRMPKVGGNKLAEHIGKHFPFSQVIIYTAFPEEVETASYGFSVHTIIRKPTPSEDLEELFRLALSKCRDLEKAQPSVNSFR